MGIFTVVLLGSAPAEAMQLSPQQKSEMKLHYDKATRAYDVGKYQEAIEEYQKAYEIGGDAAMIYNIAQAYRLSDQLSEAIRFYRRYLQRSANAPNREIVERRIAELEKVVDERKKAGVPMVPVAPMPSPTPTPPPVGTAPPPAPVPVVPPPAPPPPGSLGGGPPVTPFEPAPHAGSHRAWTVVGISLLGLGAVAGGLAIWQGKVAQEKADKLSSQSQQKGTILYNPAIQDNGKNANVLAIVSGSVGGALLIAGGIVLLTAPSSSASVEATPPRAPGATLSPVLGVGFIGAEAGWSF